MKVIFIGEPNKCNTFGPAPNLTLYNTYCVIDTFKEDGRYFYELTGYESWGYDVGGFIPLSQIDEMELLEQRQTELV